MPHILIQIDRGAGWTTRNEGHADATVEQIVAQMRTYTIGNHRAYIDGRLVAITERKGRKLIVTIIEA